MTHRRVITAVLFATCSLHTGLAGAQGPSGSYRIPSGEPGPMGATYASPYGNPYAGYAAGNAGYAAPPGAPSGVKPATYGMALPSARLGQRLLGRGESPNDYLGPTQPANPYEFANPRTAVPGRGYYGPDGIVTKRIPEEDSWDEDGPIERIISTALRGSFVRFEYLLWNIDPESARLGANLANGVNLDGFTFDNNADGLTDGIARVMTTNGITLNDNNGARVTVGIPILFGGDFEFSSFILDQAGDSVKAPDLPSDPTAFVPQYIATTLLTGGAPGSTALLYDRSFDISYQSHVWGGDAKYIFDTGTPGPGFHVRPMVGFRYLSINEALIQKGIFDNFGTVTPLVSTIESNTENRLFGSLIGARIEFEHPWFTIGADPRVGLGVNRYKAIVKSTNLLTANDGTLKTEEDDMVFSPVFEANVYGRVHLSESFSLHVGYQWLYATEVTRPAQNIYYNETTTGVPAVAVKSKTDNFFMHGLTVGGEIRFK